MDQFDRNEMELKRQFNEDEIDGSEYVRLMRELSLDRAEYERGSGRYDDNRKTKRGAKCGGPLADKAP